MLGSAGDAVGWEAHARQGDLKVRGPHTGADMEETERNQRD